MSDKLRTVFLFYSAGADERDGHITTYVPDGRGGTMPVEYTALYDDPEAAAYKWSDKRVVWSGKESDMKDSYFSQKAIENNSKTTMEYASQPQKFPS
jgi:hypothetical protein